ncbi:glycoside hydrolase family 25 protein [Thalassospira sp. CH_XMU1448-2]|uniref:glycoside hydrolase family 25 protein n=1 Tax=Thalassospira sp. CH_XMU1448-2 TaxID=3107773 RepID=UPI00300BA3A1
MTSVLDLKHIFLQLSGCLMLGSALLLANSCDASADGTSLALHGIDTSHHNGDINWQQVQNSGIAFTFVKATDGLDYLDPTFTDHFAAARKAGLLRGAYHFYETNDDGAAQAAWFIKNVTLEPGDLPPVVDIERIKAPIKGNLHQQFETFLSLLEQHYHRRPIIYTGRKFWEHAMKEHFPGNQLWIAEYGVDQPTIPVEWASWSFWQYTEELTVPGVPTKVDGTYFNGDSRRLGEILIPVR